MAIIERRAQEIGKSLLVSLPKKWATAAKLHKGSPVRMLITDQGTLMLMPELLREQPRSATIPYDDTVQRRFYREYFNGNEDIVIVAKQPLSEGQREQLDAFLRRFMNVQVVDETPSRIAAKCFAIENISIEDCLKRLWHLSLNAMDDALAGRHARGLQDQMTPFYYMLVLQVRRFLSEGAFARQNTIPLIRALDCRMVAEKLQRVGELAVHLGTSQRLSKHARGVRDVYAAAVSCFVNSDFEKAVSVWRVSKAVQAAIGRVRLRGAEQQVRLSLMQVLHYAKEISMLVR